MKNFFKLTVFLIVLTACFVGLAYDRLDIKSMDAVLTIPSEELRLIGGKFPLTSTFTETSPNTVEVDYKIFDAIPIKHVVCDVSADNYVYLGGMPLGINVNNGGLIVTAVVDVITANGNIAPAKNLIEVGDTLVAINGKKINSANEFSEIVGSCDKVELQITRNGSVLTQTVSPAVDVVSNKKRLGLLLKEDISGIGTMTYINPKNGRYGALGHPIIDVETGNHLENASGNIYKANIFSYIKGVSGKAGELTGSYNANEDLGTIDKNLTFGIFGDYKGGVDGLEAVKVGSKYGVHPGEAFIYTTIDGVRPQKYAIEIVKSTIQNSAKAKGMVIKITDKDLLSKTNGILQGMSGSPIIQDGKLVGAVTHVFINDPTKGYGMYIDWMMPN